MPQDHVVPQDPLDQEVHKVWVDHLDKMAKLEQQDLVDLQDLPEALADQANLVTMGKMDKQGLLDHEVPLEKEDHQVNLEDKELKDIE